VLEFVHVGIVAAVVSAAVVVLVLIGRRLRGTPRRRGGTL